MTEMTALIADGYGALSNLRLARVPNVRLLLAGEGPARTQVEAAIGEKNLSKHVKLLGYYSKPESLMALADVCLLTSMREGLPRVIVQYLAASKPVVVSDLPGIGELVQHDLNGIVTPSNDVAAASIAGLAPRHDEDERVVLFVF